jgi:hypothetical protein
MTTRHDFYQTDTHLIVSIYKKGVPADKVRVEAKSNQVRLIRHVRDRWCVDITQRSMFS